MPPPHNENGVLGLESSGLVGICALALICPATEQNMWAQVIYLEEE